MFLILRNTKAFLIQLNKELEIELVKELLAQGHKATGKLIESIKYEVKEYVDRIESTMMYLKYGVYLEKGIKPSEYKKPPGAAEIKALIAWIKQKRITPKGKKSIVSFAWAIAKKHRKVGFPSPASKKFAPAGRVKRFQTIVLRSKAKGIEKRLTEITDKTITVSLQDLVNNITKKYA